MITLNPYLIFKDNCEEAFDFYKLLFGGEFLYIGRYKDIPQADRQLFPISSDEKIMHVSLHINTKTILMGCDSIETFEQSTTALVNNFYLYISTNSQEEAYRIFNELSAEGKIIMPIDRTFWSTHYGMVTDKFGVHWKITFTPEQ